MDAKEDAQPRSFEEALDLVQSSPTLRKIKAHIDNSNLSADLKAILYDVAKISVKIGSLRDLCGLRRTGLFRVAPDVVVTT